MSCLGRLFIESLDGVTAFDLSSVLPNLFSSVSVYSHIPFLAWSQNWLDWILIYYVFSTTTTAFIPEYRPIYPISQLFFLNFFISFLFSLGLKSYIPCYVLV